MKKVSFLSVLVALMVLASSSVYASDDVAVDDETTLTETETIEAEKANQVIEMEDNKINVIVMKQPMNEKSNQRVILKRNWLGVYVQVNGKVKVNPLTNTYEVE